MDTRSTPLPYERILGETVPAVPGGIVHEALFDSPVDFMAWAEEQARDFDTCGVVFRLVPIH